MHAHRSEQSELSLSKVLDTHLLRAGTEVLDTHIFRAVWRVFGPGRRANSAAVTAMGEGPAIGSGVARLAAPAFSDQLAEEFSREVIGIEIDQTRWIRRLSRLPEAVWLSGGRVAERDDGCPRIEKGN